MNRWGLTFLLCNKPKDSTRMSVIPSAAKQKAFFENVANYLSTVEIKQSPDGINWNVRSRSSGSFPG